MLSLAATIPHQPAAAEGQWATSDRWLGVLQVPRPSDTIAGVLGNLPPEQMILFVGPQNEPSFILTYYLVSYLAWPRRVSAVQCGDPGQPPVLMFLPQEQGSVLSVLYYFLEPPPWIGPGQAIGPRLRLIPASEIREWIWYCPQSRS